MQFAIFSVWNRHVPGMLQACYRHVSDIFWICSGNGWNTFVKCCRHVAPCKKTNLSPGGGGFQPRVSPEIPGDTLGIPWDGQLRGDFWTDFWVVFSTKFWTDFGHVSGVIWSCFRHVLEMFQTCFGHVSDMNWTCFRHMLVMSQTCFGHVSDMIWACFACVLPMFWQCLGNVLAMFWQAVGNV